MLEELLSKLKEHESNWNKFTKLCKIISFPAKTTLLREGEISKNIYFIREGCLRFWFNNEGKDITMQFFFENQPVSGFLGREPSICTLETIESSTLAVLPIQDFYDLMNEIPYLKDFFLEFAIKRMEDYSKLFLSRIKDNPEKRYHELLKNNPMILQRIPQHFIASYLGITPVSLSRIRNRKNSFIS